MDGVAESSPPATNRGANFTVGHKIDWLSLTFPRSVDVTYPVWWTKDAVECKPFNAYNLAHKYSDGRIELRNTTRPEMGVHVVMSGSTLSNLECDEKWMIGHFLAAGARIRRFDVAIDVFGSNLQFEAIRRRIVDGTAKTRAKKFPTRGDVKLPDDTIYAGTMEGDVYTRIYNKAIEQGLPGENWKRIETVFKGDRSQPAAKAFASGAVSHVSLVRGHFDLPDYDEWTKVMNEPSVKIRAEKREIDKVREWLLKGVAPALAKELTKGDGLTFYQRFQDTVYEHYNRLVGVTDVIDKCQKWD